MTEGLIGALPPWRAQNMKAHITPTSECGSERPCEVGRITYQMGAYDYVAIAFRYTDGSEGDKLPWFLTWVGEAGSSPGRLPAGVEPSFAMIAVLDAAGVTA